MGFSGSWPLVSGADPGFFLGGGALVSCSTSVPIYHILFFLQNTSCIRKPQVISWGGGGVGTPCTLPLDPPLSLGSKKSGFFYRLKHYCCAYGNLNVKNQTAFTNIVDKHKRYVNTTCRGNATAKIRPMVRESKLQESGKFLLVVFGIRESFARGIRDPTNDWNTE